MRIQGKTIWVSDADSEFSRALVGGLVASGNFVIASGRPGTVMDELVREGRGAVAFVGLEPLRAGSLEAAGRELRELTDRVDVAVLGAARLPELALRDAFDARGLQRQMDAVLLHAARCCELVAPLLRRSRAPYLVVISPVGNERLAAGGEGASIQRAALESFAAGLRRDAAVGGAAISVIRPWCAPAGTDPGHSLSAAAMARRALAGMERRARLIQAPRTARLAAVLRASGPGAALRRKCAQLALDKGRLS